MGAVPGDAVAPAPAPAPRRRLRRPAAWLLHACAAAAASGAADAAPSLNVSLGLGLKGVPDHESLATKNQAMGVWLEGAPAGKELVVALVHSYGDIGRRADDKQYGVVWASNGRWLEEVRRVEMSCPDVELVVPAKGPYAYEARLVARAGSLHPECSCSAASGPCPKGVHAAKAAPADAWNLTSVTRSHFVALENEWRERIGDFAVVGKVNVDVTAEVQRVDQAIENPPSTAPADPQLACPGTYDDAYGKDDVTAEMLNRTRMLLPSGYVEGKWCLVRRGGCSETAKVKICENSGAVGTIIVDHGNFPGDQDIVIRYNRSAGEAAQRPVLFVSQEEGQALLSASVGGGLSVSVGPSFGGPPPPGYQLGSGLVVHELAGPDAPRRRSYPDLFETAGWIEHSDERELLFVCLPSLGAIQIYRTSRPLEELPLVGTIRTPCSQFGLHDYRIIDYQTPDATWHTLLIDPNDRMNELLYYRTMDISTPLLETKVQGRETDKAHRNTTIQWDSVTQVFAFAIVTTSGRKQIRLKCGRSVSCRVSARFAPLPPSTQSASPNLGLLGPRAGKPQRKRGGGAACQTEGAGLGESLAQRNFVIRTKCGRSMPPPGKVHANWQAEQDGLGQARSHNLTSRVVITPQFLLMD